MGTWNIKEFKKCCLNSGFDEVLLYTYSLVSRFNATVYHKKNILRKTKNIKDKRMELPPEKYGAYDYEYSFEIDALMLALNSMWDILGQLINECFIRPKIKVNKVYFPNICKNICDCSTKEAKSISPEIKLILNSIQENDYRFQRSLHESVI